MSKISLLKLSVFILILLSVFWYVSTKNTQEVVASSSNTYSAIEDSYVSQASTNTNYGTSATLINDNTSGTVRRTFLKFSITDLPTGSTINNVTLRMKATNSSGATANVKAVSNNSWTESTVNWNNAPSYNFTVISNGTPNTIVAGNIDFNVSSYVTGNGTWSMVLTQSNAVQTDWSSKEGANAPQLIVDYEPPAATSPVVLTPTDDAYVSVAAPATNFGAATALYNDNTSGNTKRTFLKFNVPTLPAGAVISSATLRMTATNNSGATVNAKGVPTTTWTESTIAWNNAPAYNSAVISNGNKTIVAGPVDFDLTSYVTSSGIWSVVLTQSNTVQTDWSSKEGTNAPQLIVSFYIPALTSPATFTPSDDAFSDQSAPSTNYGASTSLINTNATNNVHRTYLKFNVSNLPLHYRILNAKLRMTATNNSGATANVKAVTTNQWGETSLTWGNSPAYTSTAISNGTPNVTAGPVDFDVTSYVTGVGTWSMVVTQSNTTETTWSSKEGTTPPQLILTFTTIPDYGHDPIIATVGDVACDPLNIDFNNGQGQNNKCKHAAVADVVSTINPDRVILLGDIQYECGGLSAFQNSYGLSWGQFLPITSAMSGNHERNATGGTDCDPTSKAMGYRTYFQNSYSPPPLDPNTGLWYSYNLPNNWHVVNIDSDCSRVPNPCVTGGPQETWLLADLAAATAANQHILAVWHHPRFSKGDHGDDTRQHIWMQALYNAHTELILNGHEHNFQEFGPMNPSGTVDTSHGIRQFIVGTGGRNNYSANLTSVADASLIQKESTTHGALKLVLHANSYDWQYFPIAGQTTSMVAGSASTHQ